MRGDADSSMADTGCEAEQDHALLCGELRCRLCQAYSLHRPARYAAGGGGGGFGGLGGGGFGGFGGSMEATHSRLWPAWRRRQPILAPKDAPAGSVLTWIDQEKRSA